MNKSTFLTSVLKEITNISYTAITRLAGIRDEGTKLLRGFVPKEIEYSSWLLSNKFAAMVETKAPLVGGKIDEQTQFGNAREFEASDCLFVFKDTQSDYEEPPSDEEANLTSILTDSQPTYSTDGQLLEDLKNKSHSTYANVSHGINMHK